MTAILDPNLGLCNPPLGLAKKYSFAMTGKKAPKVDGNARKTFADNAKRLMEARYQLSSNKPKALANEAGISLSSVQRAISGDTAPTLDTVEAIANALRVSPSSLLVLDSGIRRRTGTHN